MNRVFLRYRRGWVVAAQLILVIAANHLAFWLRFDGDVPEWARQAELRTIPWLVTIRLLLFLPLRLHEGLWRYTGLWDACNIAVGVIASSVVFWLLVVFGFEFVGYPRSVLIIDAGLLIGLMIGIRLPKRVHRELSRPRLNKRVLIFGAGDAGELLVRDMKNNPGNSYEPIGFIDDDVTKVGHRIHGVPVMGTRGDLTRIIAREKPAEILVAIPRADAATVRELVHVLERFKMPIKTLPSLSDLIDGRVTATAIRNLSVEDLLTRPSVGLDTARLRILIAGKVVLVTGAGGSIGSELSRQIASLAPAVLVLYERHENSLHAIASDLTDRGHGSIVRPLIGDVTDACRLNDVMREHAPNVVFHAAAHKHVPLMEMNVSEAVKNNVTGTRLVADAARLHGVERMILISSDKAVNPTSVMGATKRVAELIMQRMVRSGRTAFVTVRFGNVLGSNGSVVPRFLAQIRAGGPVTVTDPQMERYFMLTSEAVQLVLHAAALGRQGGIYVLDMGEQIKLVDMARDLIRLAGFVPDEDIRITFTGMRPGEKLSEDLLGNDEIAEPSPIDKIRHVREATASDRGGFDDRVAELEHLAQLGDARRAIEQLHRIVPNFSPTEEVTTGFSNLQPVHARG